MWLIGSLGVDRRRLNAWRRLFHGGVFVEPHMPELREFREHFLSELQVIARAIRHRLWKMTLAAKKQAQRTTDLCDRMQISFLRPSRSNIFHPCTQEHV